MFNTFQAFEELLRANDIDYYMGQSFREQLAQNIALAQRVVTKISGRREHPLIFLCCHSVCWFGIFTIFCNLLYGPVPIGDYAESHGDKTDHELLALR